MVANDNVSNAVNGGMLDTIKQKASPAAIAEKFNISRNTLIDIGLYAGIGFLAGFLLKKYSTFVISLVLFVAGLVVLQQFDFLAIGVNWPKVNTLLGLQPAAVASNDMLTLVWVWLKSNVIISSSFVVGFLIGLKVG